MDGALLYRSMVFIHLSHDDQLVVILCSAAAGAPRFGSDWESVGWDTSVRRGDCEAQLGSWLVMLPGGFLT